MRYLRLAADLGEPSLSDPDGAVSLGALGLSPALVAELRAWNTAYQPVVPADAKQRVAMRDLIDSLDQRGREIAAKVGAELAPAKVEYYSEGLLRLLPAARTADLPADPRDESQLCRVCGYRDDEPPWGADGRTPSFASCPCCGVEWGYQDSSPAGVLRFREAWLAAGAPWRDPLVRPDGLTTEARLQRLTR